MNEALTGATALSSFQRGTLRSFLKWLSDADLSLIEDDDDDNSPASYLLGHPRLDLCQKAPNTATRSELAGSLAGPPNAVFFGQCFCS